MITTVNDLIGLNYANLRNPIVPQSGINSTQPLSRSFNESPYIDSSIYRIPSTMDQNSLAPLGVTNQQPMLANTTGIAPLLESEGQIPFGSSVDNIQGFTDKVDFSTPRKKMDLSNLLRLATSIAIPGSGLITGGLRGLAGLNRRIQQSNFARSKNLMDYLDARKYGGIDARNRAASQNMREARAIQKQLDLRTQSGKYDDGGDRNRGQTPSRTKTTSKTTSTRSSRQTSGSGGLHSNY